MDLDDRVVGYGTKEEVHKRGTLHRAFSIFIVHEGKMLIQKRNVNKYHSGGLWTNACCSHQRKGEQLAEAIHRRLEEELGFDCDLEERFNFVYRTQFSEELFEYELDHVFLGEYGGEVVLNEEEAEEIEWVELGELKRRLLEKPEQFTSWFLIAAPRLLREVLPSVTREEFSVR